MTPLLLLFYGLAIAVSVALIGLPIYLYVGALRAGAWKHEQDFQVFLTRLDRDQK